MQRELIGCILFAFVHTVCVLLNFMLKDENVFLAASGVKITDCIPSHDFAVKWIGVLFVLDSSCLFCMFKKKNLKNRI